MSELSTEKTHEFAEDHNDASMCLCSIPELYHDQVYPPTGGAS